MTSQITSDYTAAFLQVQTDVIRCPFNCSHIAVSPPDTNHIIQPIARKNGACVFFPGDINAYVLTYEDQCVNRIAEEAQRSNSVNLSFLQECISLSNFYKYLGENHSTRLYVELVKSNRKTSSGNPVLSVLLSTRLASDLRADQLTCQSCILTPLLNSEMQYEFEVHLTKSEAHIFIDQGVLQSILYQPNEASNTVNFFKQKGELFSSELSCEQQIDTSYTTIIYCEAVFSTAISAFHPDYIFRSGGTLKGWAIVSVSSTSSLVSFLLTCNSDVTIYLLFGAASTEEEYWSLESNQVQIHLVNTQFSTALSILSTDSEVCRSEVVKMKVWTEEKAVGISRNAFVMQGLEIISILRENDEYVRDSGIDWELNAS